MPHTAPQRTPQKPHLLVALFFVLLALLLSGANCDIQDYLETEILIIESKANNSQQRTVNHPYVGRNSVDYSIRNDGTQDMEVNLTATTILPANTEETDQEEAGGLNIPGLDTELLPPDIILESINRVTNTIILGPGKSQSGRFSEEELSTGISLTMEVDCVSENCLGELEFVVLLGRPECYQNADCDANQDCDVSVGRCITTDNAGCQSIPQKPLHTAPLWIMALLALCTRTSKTRTRLHNPLRAKLWSALLFFLVLSISSTAWARRDIFNNPTAELTTSAGVKSWTGKLGKEAGTGLSLDVSQSLHYKYLGLHTSVGTAYFLTNPQPPPLFTGLQTYSFRIGPRIIIPLFGSFHAHIDAEYERMGVISNSLVRLTGPDLSFNGAGIGGSIRWVPAPFIVEARTTYTQVFGIGSGIVSATINLGMLGRL